MKCEIMPSLVKLEKKELQELCMQVKETIATNIELQVKETSFGIADLWRLQQKMKSAKRRWNDRNRTLLVRGW